MAVVRPHRVLMTADTIGGVWTYALDLARDLVRRGVTVHLATMGAPPRPAQRHAASGAGVLLYESSHRLEWMEDAWDDVERAGVWLQALEERLEPDVVHLNGYAHAGLFRAPVLVVAHSCVFSWWNAVLGCDPPERYARYQREVKAGLAAAQLVAAPTRAMLDALQRHYGPVSRTAVVPNGARPSRYRASVKESFILCAGRIWDEGKNLAVVGSLAGRIPWPILAAGTTRHPDGTDRPLDGVGMLGLLETEELAELMGRAAIFLHPARYEPFGLAPLEAANAGCALVLGDLPSLREVWGDAAVFVPPDKPDAIAAAVRCLCDDPARREAFADRARERAARLTTAATATATLQLYEALVRAPRRPPENVTPA